MAKFACQRENTPQEDIWIALCISEDTCSEHSVFMCEECFNLEGDNENA